MIEADDDVVVNNSTDQADNTVPDSNNEADQSKTEVKGERWDTVEFTPEQQRRFNRLYAQVKRNNEVTKQLIEDNNKLVNRLHEIESQNVTKELSSAMKVLRTARVKAYENGDFNKIDEIDEEIDKLKDQVKSVESEKSKITKQIDKNNENIDVLEPEIRERITSWVTEKTPDGELVRPFADPSHKQHRRFMKVVEIILTDPDIGGKDADEVFDEIDKALAVAGLAKRTENRKLKQTVLPSLGSDISSKQPKQLTQQQRYVARRMFPNEKDPEKAYIEAMKYE